MDELFIDSESFGVTDKAPDQSSGVLSTDNSEELEILKFVVEYLQLLGKQMDQEFRQNFATPEEYHEKTKVSNLVQTRQGTEYLIISALLGMVANNPSTAQVLAPFMQTDELFINLMNSIDLTIDPETQRLNLIMGDQPTNSPSKIEVVSS